MDKHLLRVGSAKRRRSVQAVMGLVMKTIGDSIQQPLDVDDGATAFTAAGDTPGNDDRRWRVFFRLASLRKRSQSQGFIASTTRIDESTDSVAGLHRSSTTSITGATSAGATGRPDESEIKDFQKTLINLPIYEVDTHRAQLMNAAGRDDVARGLSMSRFSSVPDQLEYLHVLSAQFIDKGREQKETTSTPTAAGRSQRDQRDVDKDTVAALPSDGRRCRADTGGSSGGGGSRRRRTLTSSSSTSSRESAVIAAGTGGSGRRTKLTSDSSTSKSGAAAMSLTPLPSEAIVFHFAAATPCESPISLGDQPLMTFTDMSTVNDQEQVAARLLDNSEFIVTQPQIICDSTQQISQPHPASLSDSRSSLTLRPQNLWNDQNAPPGHLITTPSTMSSLSPKSPLNRADHALHSPNLSLNLPSTPGCCELPAPVCHRAVMTIVERWVDACSGVDLDATPLVRKEMSDFLGKMASLGSEYRAWTNRIRDKLKLEVSHFSDFLIGKLYICYSYSIGLF